MKKILILLLFFGLETLVFAQHPSVVQLDSLPNFDRITHVEGYQVVTNCCGSFVSDGGQWVNTNVAESEATVITDETLTGDGSTLAPLAVDTISFIATKSDINNIDFPETTFDDAYNAQQGQGERTVEIDNGDLYYQLNGAGNDVKFALNSNNVFEINRFGNSNTYNFRVSNGNNELKAPFAGNDIATFYSNTGARTFRMYNTSKGAHMQFGSGFGDDRFVSSFGVCSSARNFTNSGQALLFDLRYAEVVGAGGYNFAMTLKYGDLVSSAANSYDLFNPFFSLAGQSGGRTFNVFSPSYDTDMGASRTDVLNIYNHEPPASFTSEGAGLTLRYLNSTRGDINVEDGEFVFRPKSQIGAFLVTNVNGTRTYISANTVADTLNLGGTNVKVKVVNELIVKGGEKGKGYDISVSEKVTDFTFKGDIVYSKLFERSDLPASSSAGFSAIPNIKDLVKIDLKFDWSGGKKAGGSDHFLSTVTNINGLDVVRAFMNSSGTLFINNASDEIITNIDLTIFYTKN